MAHKDDQEVVDKMSKPAARSRSDRLRTRAERLGRISTPPGPGRDQVSKATRALAQIHHAGGRGLTHVDVRSTFATRRQEPSGEMSDRRPPKGWPSPVCDLTAPRGIALQLQLVALFMAQTQKGRHSGDRVRFDLPLEARDANEVGWIDLVVPHSGRTASAVYAASRRDNRLRQVKGALDTLAGKELVDLPNSGKAGGKYDGFRLLDEGGRRPVGDPVVYRVPSPGSDVITIPVDFFLQGWVHVLTGSEIALWLMLRHLSAPLTDAVPEPVSIPGELRLRRYGVSRDAYKGWWLLEHAGLVDVLVDPNRRSNGTVIDFDPEDLPDRHHFSLTDDGLSQPAAAQVQAALSAALRGDPIGVDRVQTPSTAEGVF